jgi:hypothetical protein
MFVKKVGNMDQISQTALKRGRDRNITKKEMKGKRRR